MLEKYVITKGNTKMFPSNDKIGIENKIIVVKPGFPRLTLEIIFSIKFSYLALVHCQQFYLPAFLCLI